MDLGLNSVLCTKVDVHAGDWPSQSFLGLFHIAGDCVKPKMVQRAEVVEVWMLYSPMFAQHPKSIMILYMVHYISYALVTAVAVNYVLKVENHIF